MIITKKSSWTVNIPHLFNATKKVARELNRAVATLMGADAGIELAFSVGSRGIFLVLFAPGLADHRVDAPNLCHEDHFSQPIRAALLGGSTQAWLRAAGTLAHARQQAQQAANAVTLVITS